MNDNMRNYIMQRLEDERKQREKELSEPHKPTTHYITNDDYAEMFERIIYRREQQDKSQQHGE